MASRTPIQTKKSCTPWTDEDQSLVFSLLHNRKGRQVTEAEVVELMKTIERSWCAIRTQLCLGLSDNRITQKQFDYIGHIPGDAETNQRLCEQAGIILQKSDVKPRTNRKPKLQGSPLNAHGVQEYLVRKGQPEIVAETPSSVITMKTDSDDALSKRLVSKVVELNALITECTRRNIEVILNQDDHVVNSPLSVEFMAKRFFPPIGK